MVIKEVAEHQLKHEGGRGRKAFEKDPDSEAPNQKDRYEQEKVLKHVQEVLFEKKLKGVYARD